MEKFISVILAVLVLSMLCGCEKEQLIDETETTPRTENMTVSTAKTTAAETYQTTFVGLAESTAATAEATAVPQENDEGEELLLRFLEFLKTGADDQFIYGELGYADPFEIYDFWDDFTIDSYSYEYRGDGVFNVTLTCSDSTLDIFPNGNSDWVFNSTYQTCFIPADREEKHNITISFGDPDYNGTDSTLYTVYNAAVDFSRITNSFEADENWFANYTDADAHSFYHAYNPYFTVYDYEKDEGYDITPVEFAAAVKKLYNINITTEKARTMTDETGFMVKNCGHDGNWVYSDLADFEETEDEARITVSYYGDSLYLYPAVQSEYTFSKNEDGTITLQQVEKIFDTGYAPARGSI